MGLGLSPSGSSDGLQCTCRPTRPAGFLPSPCSCRAQSATALRTLDRPRPGALPCPRRAVARTADRPGHHHGSSRQEQAMSPAPFPPTPAPPRTTTSSRPRVLVVEDHADNRQSLRLLLEAWGGC